MNARLWILLAFALPVSTGFGQVIGSGDFNDLKVGMLPNCSEPAGPWGWPSNYVEAGICETAPGEFTIVPTGSFDAGAPGNSLHHDVELSGEADTPLHLPNLLLSTIDEATHPVVSVTFDIWVVEASTRGGNVYVGGDHGGGGFSNQTDRGPHLGWQADGILSVAPQAPGECPSVILDSYPAGAWQHVRLVIDLAADRYDVWWAERGDPLVLLAADLKFINQVELDHIDRFTVAHFDGFPNPDCGVPGGPSHSYLDNVVFQVCTADIDGSRDVDFGDLLAVLSNWGPCPGCPEDLDDDHEVGFGDLLIVLSNWGPC